MLWFIVKVWVFLFVFIWLRGTLPRLRYDQFMRLGWKILIPVALVWVMVVATVRALRNEGYDASPSTVLVVARVRRGACGAGRGLAGRVRARRRRTAAPDTARGRSTVRPMAGGFPVPPLPGQTLPRAPVRPCHRRDAQRSDTQEDSDA